MGEMYEWGKRLLKLLRKHDPEFYKEIKGNTDYPGEDDGTPEYDMLVDKCEIETIGTLCENITEDIEGQLDEKGYEY